MHFVIMGSGRVGAALAGLLDERGHSVSIIDRSSESFRRLPGSFSGQRVRGIGYDRQALIQAGIEEAYAFAAVSNGDNSNIIAARVAREVFGVEKVVARIYDPRRADVYQHLGIPTIGTVRRTTQAVLQWMLPSDTSTRYTDETATIQLVHSIPAKSWIGRSFADFEAASNSRIGYILRFGRPELPNSEGFIQENDEIFVFCHANDRSALDRLLTRGIEETDYLS